MKKILKNASEVVAGRRNCRSLRTCRLLRLWSKAFYPSLSGQQANTQHVSYHRYFPYNYVINEHEFVYGGYIP